MGKYIITKTEIPDLVVIEPVVYRDDRGIFMETYTRKNFIEQGINAEFVQDNYSKSAKGVLRGLHFQKEHSQAKLIRVVSGRIYDVTVDLRKNSETYGRSFGITLTAENKKQLFIPKGFAHGLLVLEDETELIYKVDDYWFPNDEGGLLWNDPDICIKWPIKENDICNVILSEKDKTWPILKDLDSPF
ncbi:MAG: dTDP-4-dehydrorhamnose 3,5-epimerase [Deltaproteobacteria bacterium]